MVFSIFTIHHNQFFSFIHICVHCLGHLSPLLPHFQAEPGILQFCWRENISDNKKDIAFLLVWDKDSYTERLHAHVCYNAHWIIFATSWPPSHMVTSASLRLLYLLLYGEHIKHFQVLGFLPFLCSSHVLSPIEIFKGRNTQDQWLKIENMSIFQSGDFLFYFW
jgi:hypothetical protein